MPNLSVTLTWKYCFLILAFLIETELGIAVRTQGHFSIHITGFSMHFKSVFALEWYFFYNMRELKIHGFMFSKILVNTFQETLFFI